MTCLHKGFETYAAPIARHWLWVAILLAAIVIVFTAFATNISPAHAATGTVTSAFDGLNADTTPGTLRYALGNYNPGDTISINSGLVITLTANLPDITSDVTMNGNGATLIGGTDIRGFAITGGTVISMT